MKSLTLLALALCSSVSAIQDADAQQTGLPDIVQFRRNVTINAGETFNAFAGLWDVPANKTLVVQTVSISTGGQGCNGGDTISVALDGILFGNRTQLWLPAIRNYDKASQSTLSATYYVGAGTRLNILAIRDRSDCVDESLQVSVSGYYLATP
jgi:hypothetical protein